MECCAVFAVSAINLARISFRLKLTASTLGITIGEDRGPDRGMTPDNRRSTVMEVAFSPP